MKLKKLYQAIACTTLVAPALLMAQESPEIEEVVVTGSLIRGTPLDAALPVEVYNQADLQLQGDPTALEFAKSLSVSGPTSGEAYYFGGAGLTGNVQYNLRGIGSDKTLSLFNGRRITQNTSVIPSIALQRTEILKDGAAVTYGADATGGVVNFITQDNFEGFEVATSYKYIDGSDGDYNVGFKAGFGGPNTNVLLAAEWDHRSQLRAPERSFTSLPYGENPAPWSGLTNVAGWVPRMALPEVPGNTPNTEWGNPLGLVPDFTRESCEAVGGIDAGNNFSCLYNYIPYYNLVEDNDIYRLFGQVTTDVTDTMEFHFRVAYSQVYTPHAYGSPSQPVIRGPARSTGATYQLYVPQSNPFVDEFAQRSGWADNPLYGLTQGYTPITYRAFAHGGLDTFAHSSNTHSTPREIDNRYLHATTGFQGEWDNGMGYDFGLTFNNSHTRNDNPDMLLYRVQEAINGFGGPNCNAPDQDPNRFGTQNPEMAGTGDCMWYNPFASNFADMPVFGLANPSHVPGSENPDELIEWMFNPRYQETVSWNVTADAVVGGETPLELAGGTVGWAAGSQWRQTKFRQSVPDPFYNGSVPCAWPNEYNQNPLPPEDPDFSGCTPDEPGPFQFFDTNTPNATSQDQLSVFGELSLPILPNIYATAAVRHERFSGDLNSTVYKLSAKWDATENLGFRGSYGTNYQAPGAGLQPGNITSGVNNYTIAGGAWRGAQTFTQTGINPEEATVWSAGAIWQSDGFTAGSNFSLIIDYFDIETEDELGLLASANDIANAVFSISPDGAGAAVPRNGTALADCSHPLVDRVIFNGNCVQGQTTANDFSEIRTDYGNGPGQSTSGFDIQSRYGFPLGAGDMNLSLTATYITNFEYTETVLDGYVLDPGADRLGFLNYATIANAVSELRGNVSANYSQGIHNYRGVVNYISGVDDERFFTDDGNVVGDAALTPNGINPETGTAFGPTMYGVRAKDWVTADFHYTVDLPWARLGASVINIFDTKPPESRQELGYDPRIGNPLLRQFQVSLRREF